MEECFYCNLAGWYKWKQSDAVINIYLCIYLHTHTFIQVFSVTQTAVKITCAVTEG